MRSVERDEVIYDRGDGRMERRVYHNLIHGGINHGGQRVEPKERRNEPITYFHPDGPVGELFSRFKESKSRRPYGVIGLGTGTLAAYALNGQHVVFYEIDPSVRDLSLPPDGSEPYFYFLVDARKRGARVEVDIGDGRLRLRDGKVQINPDPKAPPEVVPPGYFQVLVIDAFSSDAIPVHLLTMEALELYLEKLAPDGVLLYNVTNNYVNLPPVLADQALARDLVCLFWSDDADNDERFGVDWLALVRKQPGAAARGDARRAAHAAALLLAAPPAAQALAAPMVAHLTVKQRLPGPTAHKHPEWPTLLQQVTLAAGPDERGWRVLLGDRKRRVWRDNYTNLLSVVTWSR